MRRLHRLTVDHRRRRARFTSRPLAVYHQRHIMDGLEQEPPRQLAEPAVDRPPMPEVGRQHAPAAARTDQITHRVIPTCGLADSLGLPKSWRVRIDGGEW